MKKLLFIVIIFPCFAVFGQEIDYSIASNYDYKYICNSILLKDTTVKAVWREEKYDPVLNQTVSILNLNDEYFKNISEPEKAVIGYIATIVGNECQWDWDPNAEQNNIKCRILSALSLGYQCSDANKEYFYNWFSGSSEILKEVDNCKSAFINSYKQNTIDKIVISTDKDEIKIKYTALSANVRDQKFDGWTEELTFRLSNNKLELVKRNMKKKK